MKESSCNAGDLGSIPGSRRSPGEGNGKPLNYSSLENSINRSIIPWGQKELDRPECLTLFSVALQIRPSHRVAMVIKVDYHRTYK